MWWTRREQSYRTTAYQVANSIAPIIGPLITWGVGRVTTGGIRPYQAIFLTIGALSMFFVPSECHTPHSAHLLLLSPHHLTSVCAWMMPNSPTTAKFLRHGDDRLIALHRIRENNTGTKSSTFKWPQAWEAFRDVKTYVWGLMFFLMSVPPGGLGAFGGLIVKGLGFDSFASILMQMPTGVIGIFFMIFWTWLVNKIKLRYPVAGGICLFPIAGAAVLVSVDKSNIGALMSGYYMIFVATIPQLLYSWANLNASGSTKRVVTTATMFGCMCIGNIVGPQVYLESEAPHYRTGLYTAMACWALLCVVIFCMGFYLAHLNRQQEKRREALGLPTKLKDMSIMSLEEADAYKIELMETLARQGNVDAERLYENSFDDMTDFENPMFMYVL